MSLLADLVLSVVSGGATGLLGAGISLVGDYFKQKMIFAHEAKMTELEQKTLEIEYSGKARVADIEAEGARDVADSEALAASHASDRAAYSKKDSYFLVFVDFIRGMIRPSITVYLAVIVTLMYLDARAVLDQMGTTVLGPEKVYGLLETITISILYITTTVILWWFGTRNKVGPSFFSSRLK